MFPIIPQHLTRLGVETPTSPVRLTASVDGKTPRCGRRVRLVTAGVDLPRGVVSEEVDVEEVTRVAEPHTQDTATMTVDLDKEGRLRCLTAPCRWWRELRLAGDCHSFNILLHRAQHSRSKILLQVVRPIRAREELQMWFSDQTLGALAIPFLTPSNIQGDKHYVCHECGRSFETPNPLKIHLARQCSQLSMGELYTRLSTNHRTRLVHEAPPTTNPILNLRTLVVPTTETPFKFELRLSPSSPRSTACESPSSSLPFPSTSQDDKAVERKVNGHPKPVKTTLTRHSAFKPYWKRTLVTSGHANLKMEVNSKDHPSNMTAFSYVPNVDVYPPSLTAPHVVYKMAAPHTENGGPMNELLAPHSSHLADTAANYFQHATQMETLVSNLGRSKQGHLCIYCGKIYSRKYGLKIHIRTHTGFKPLQCKYCMRPFGDPSNLNKHVRLHAEGATPYKCGLCGKVLVRRRDLERHIKSRHSSGLDGSHPSSPETPDSPLG